MTRCILRLALASLAATPAAGACQRPDSRGATPAVVSYDVGGGPRAIAVADLDGDGRLDVAVANSADGTVSILLGAGGGGLRPAAGSPVAVGREPSDVEAADLDRDGDVDLAFPNHESPSVTVLLNDGRARFTPAPGSPFDTGARPHVHGLASGDIDGDGWTDLATESADTREVRVLRGGPRGFGAVVAVSVGTMPYYRLGTGDVVGDSFPDVLVPGHGDSTVRVVHREGTRLVSAAAARLAGQPWIVVGDDVNGDRRRDLVVVQTDAVSVWLGGDRGTFTPAPGSPFALRGATEVATGDLDGDGMADVAIGPWDGDEVTVLLGPALAARRVRACERPIGLAVADLDGDRRGELLVACATGSRVVVVTVPRGR
ncbi:MAG TPA: VCBS repeat-containing protein [Gemmatimonadaceae bacterium]|nr:VCBS repeat-containing protein [Gemmatimonadaceae bacterium]